MPTHIPEGYAALTPYLCLEDTAGFLIFAEKAFGAEPRALHRDDDGRLVHGELTIEGCRLEISEVAADWKPTGGAFHLFVEDPDATYARAIDAGAESLYPVTDHAYGERSGGVKDRWGQSWYLAAVTDAEARGG
ncbi:MAG: VOC family protein [Acidobacteriota bacterium]